jgi:hypothetical protein
MSWLHRPKREWWLKNGFRRTRAPAERLMLTAHALWTRLTLLAWPGLAGWLMLWHLVQPIPKARR